uniref:Uncharacterized protein n=1 Tax=Parascaris equorum TaxID=6256 RepID=A0A914R8A5_PAREQ
MHTALEVRKEESNVRGPVAQWITRRSTEPKIVGSNPARVAELIGPPAGNVNAVDRVCVLLSNVMGFLESTLNERYTMDHSNPTQNIHLVVVVVTSNSVMYRPTVDRFGVMFFLSTALQQSETNKPVAIRLSVTAIASCI